MKVLDTDNAETVTQIKIVWVTTLLSSSSPFLFCAISDSEQTLFKRQKERENYMDFDMKTVLGKYIMEEWVRGL